MINKEIREDYPNLNEELVATISPSTYRWMKDKKVGLDPKADDEAFRLWFNTVFQPLMKKLVDEIPPSDEWY